MALGTRSRPCFPSATPSVYLVFRWSGSALHSISATSIKMLLLCLTTSLLSLLRLVHSIEVTPNSKCFSLCANEIGSEDNIADGKHSWTVGNNVVCEDDQLAGPNSTVRGRKWKECLTCELASTAVDSPSNENELYWVLCKLAVSTGHSGSMAKKMHN